VRLPSDARSTFSNGFPVAVGLAGSWTTSELASAFEALFAFRVTTDGSPILKSVDAGVHDLVTVVLTVTGTVIVTAAESVSVSALSALTDAVLLTATPLDRDLHGVAVTRGDPDLTAGKRLGEIDGERAVVRATPGARVSVTGLWRRDAEARSNRERVELGGDDVRHRCVDAVVGGTGDRDGIRKGVAGTVSRMIDGLRDVEDRSRRGVCRGGSENAADQSEEHGCDGGKAKVSMSTRATRARIGRKAGAGKQDSPCGHGTGGRAQQYTIGQQRTGLRIPAIENTGGIDRPHRPILGSPRTGDRAIGTVRLLA
jgi:hypothetical protein